MQTEENLRCVRGRILHAKDVRLNATDRSRVYVRHTVFSFDCPENRLVKTCARRLLRISTDNRLRLARIVDSLEGVGESADVGSDLSACGTDRDTVRYGPLLAMCAVFLNGHGYVPTSGEPIEMSLMFDMSQLFEDAVVGALRERHGSRGRRVLTNRTVARRRLYGIADMVPDAMLMGPGEGDGTIVDAKWKTYGDSEMGDLYQVFTYSVCYGCDRAYLVYPSLGESDRREGVHEACGMRLTLVRLLVPLPTDGGPLDIDIPGAVARE